jgi:hypothetical protein
LQLGAKEQAANIKLSRALEILQEGSMPQANVASEADEGDAEATVSNFDAVKDMAVAEILTESLELFDEAITLMSPSRLDESKTRVRKYTELLFEHLRFIDECLCVFMRAIVEDYPLEQVFHVADICCSEAEVQWRGVGRIGC